MKVLIGFEKSQTVTLEFRALGIECFSCDIKPCDGILPQYHIQSDIYEAINSENWDLIGLHPVCTKLTLSGNRHYGNGKDKNHERLLAINNTINLFNYACKKTKYVYMENPMGALNGNNLLPKPQIIQPYFFGDSYQKTTCLWLNGLKPLYHNKHQNLFDNEVTHVSPGEFFISKSGKKMPLWIAKTASTNNEKNRDIRSKTFPGIARQMAKQWSKEIVF